MKRIIPLLLLTFVGLLPYSCVRESAMEEPQDDNRIPLTIYGSIDQQATKATAMGFVDKDAVGLYAVNYTDANTVAGTLQTSGNQADNVKYVFDEANHKWVPVHPVYYKDINTHADLYLYYPYQGSITDVNSSNFEVQKDQSTAAGAATLSGYEASDWMWGKGTDITPTMSSVKIELGHKLSAVELTLVKGDGFDDPGEFESLSKSVILTGTTRKATLDYATGEATPVGSAQLDGIVMCPQTNGKWRAIVIPQTVSAGVKLFAITLNGISYSYSQGEAVDYLTGKQMNVSLTLNKKTPSGEYEITLGNTQITDWTEDLNSHGGEARQYYVVTLAEAGTLQATIEAAGKNPAKIRNLKITGNVNADDFYFMRDNMPILEAVNMKECSIVEKEDFAEDVIPENAFSGKSSLYFFVFPERVVEIGNRAFQSTNLSGALIIPTDTKIIGEEAFGGCSLLSSLSLPDGLTTICSGAFGGNISLSGSLEFPETLTAIGGGAFSSCRNLTGNLILPHNLVELGAGAFRECTGFTGDLSIPDGITTLPTAVFYGCSGFRGHLNLNNVTVIEPDYFATFSGCHFQGELVIPEGVTELNSMDLNFNDGIFSQNEFTSIILPSTLKKIGSHTFQNCPKLMSVTFGNQLLQIGEEAFSGCSQLTGIELPSSLLSIGARAFNGCFNISEIVCNATQVPMTASGAFDGVGKDNVTVEVPENSVTVYQVSPVWSEFDRISAHHDFSISRRTISALNGEYSKTITVRAPSGLEWSIANKPDWVTVTPSSGTGKTDVTVTIGEMARTDEEFELNEGTFNDPSYTNYKGRKGDVVFLLNEKADTTTLNV